MGNSSLKMKKYYERDKFSYDEKLTVCRKTDEVCSHCGKKMYIGYGATVDHFIPLNKGGSNRMINLIPLCKECNDEKEDKLYTLSYVPYLKDKFKKELQDYLDSYVSVMDYVQRHRLLAYDEYEDYLLITPPNARKASVGIKSTYKVKLATWNDLDRMHEYLVKYLKKNKCLDSEETARENIIFWLQFGCIYYIERNGEIAVMSAMTIKQLEEHNDFRGISNQPYMYVFPYYNNDMSFNLVKNLILNISLRILQENNLQFFPMSVLFLKEENIQYKISSRLGANITDDVVAGFNIMRIIIGDGPDANEYKNPEDMTESEYKTYSFFKKFDDITDQLITYFRQYGSKDDVGWMINSILSTERIKQTELDQYISYVTEED